MAKRILDPQAKLLRHGGRVKQWVDGGMSRPILVEISPTGYCNASCPWCFFKDNTSSESIDSEVMFDTIEDLPKLAVRAINWSGGGEPTLHPDFEKFVFYANRCGLKQGLFTNSYNHIPLQKNFDWIRISLTETGYEKITRPEVPFGICLNQIESQTEQDIRRLCLDAKEFGAEYFQVRPALIGSFLEQPKLVTPNYLKEYNTDSFCVHVTDYKYTEAVKPKYYDKCYGYHFCPSIDWKGNLSACMYLSHEEGYMFGNLNNQSLLDIWASIPESVEVIDRCQNCCKNHSINALLYRVKNVEQIDFL